MLKDPVISNGSIIWSIMVAKYLYLAFEIFIYVYHISDISKRTYETDPSNFQGLKPQSVIGVYHS